MSRWRTRRSYFRSQIAPRRGRTHCKYQRITTEPYRHSCHSIQRHPSAYIYRSSPRYIASDRLNIHANTSIIRRMSIEHLPSRTNPVAAVFRDHFEIQPRDAEVLACLFVGRGAPIARDDLAVRGGTTPKAVHAHVGNLRGAMTPAAVDCVWKKGYALSPEGVAACEAALEQAREALSAVA